MHRATISDLSFPFGHAQPPPFLRRRRTPKRAGKQRTKDLSPLLTAARRLRPHSPETLCTAVVAQPKIQFLSLSVCLLRIPHESLSPTLPPFTPLLSTLRMECPPSSTYLLGSHALGPRSGVRLPAPTSPLPRRPPPGERAAYRAWKWAVAAALSHGVRSRETGGCAMALRGGWGV